MGSKFAGAFSAAGNLFTGALALGKGMMNSNLPVRASLNHITSAPVARAHHSLAVVKGRAYIFGGETSPGELASNDMHIVILPSSGVVEADYQSIKARPLNPNGAVPCARKGHSAVVVGEEVYVFGGEDSNGKPADETEGVVWVFHPTSNSWELMEPTTQNAPAPRHRSWSALASTEEPRPKEQQSAAAYPPPQQPLDPARVIPEPPSAGTWGTIFIVGGQSLEEDKSEDSDGLLNDAWAFDIRTRAWSSLPSMSGPARSGASIEIAGEYLYRFGGVDGTSGPHGGIDWLDVGNVWKHAVAGTSALQSGWIWNEMEIGEGENGGPGPRSGSSLISVVTEQGREYLLVVGGLAPNSTFLDDIWYLPLPLHQTTSVTKPKDTPKKTAKDTKELTWTEMVYEYVDSEGDVHKENVLVPGTKGFAPRSSCVVARGTDVEGASIVIWGGIGNSNKEKMLEDGWMVTITR